MYDPSFEKRRILSDAEHASLLLLRLTKTAGLMLDYSGAFTKSKLQSAISSDLLRAHSCKDQTSWFSMGVVDWVIEANGWITSPAPPGCDWREEVVQRRPV